MSESSTLTPKVNPLMNLFLKRQATHALPPKRPVKKVKLSDDKQSDPLYQILSWRDGIPVLPTPAGSACRLFTESSIVESDPQRWGTNLQGIFINVDWATTSMEAFRKLVLTDRLLSNGMVFVWGSKTNIGDLLDVLGEMGYVYAENFAFVMMARSKIPHRSTKGLAGNSSLLNFFGRGGERQEAGRGKEKVGEGVSGNEYEMGRVTDPSAIFLNSESQYFCGSQKVLYMFRKINKKQSLELRHQRTSDVYFTIGEGDNLDWKAKEVVYKMIQTLLINANYKEKQELKLLQLWATPNHTRKGWIMVSQQPDMKEEVLEKSVTE